MKYIVEDEHDGRPEQGIDDADDDKSYGSPIYFLQQIAKAHRLVLFSIAVAETIAIAVTVAITIAVGTVSG